jgi:hypothetical protein
MRLSASSRREHFASRILILFFIKWKETSKHITFGLPPPPPQLSTANGRVRPVGHGFVNFQFNNQAIAWQFGRKLIDDVRLCNQHSRQGASLTADVCGPPECLCLNVWRLPIRVEYHWLQPQSGHLTALEYPPLLGLYYFLWRNSGLINDSTI